MVLRFGKRPHFAKVVRYVWAIAEEI